MAWQHNKVVLGCGCKREDVADYDKLEAGVGAKCGRHGATTIHHLSRVYESTGSRDFKLGVKA